MIIKIEAKWLRFNSNDSKREKNLRKNQVFFCLQTNFLACCSMRYSKYRTRHHKPLLITSRSWIQAIHKDKIFWNNLLKNKEMVFENGVKNIQAYNGARTVYSKKCCWRELDVSKSANKYLSRSLINKYGSIFATVDPFML